MLQLDSLSKSFGGVHAVSTVSMEVESGEIVGLIGPNGAGKTTLFNLVSGLLKPDSGTIRFNGNSIDGLPTHQRAAAGIARTFQHVQLMPHYSVLENVMLGCHLVGRAGILDAIFRPRSQRREEMESRENATRALALCDIAHLADEMPSNLAYGIQRRVEVARAIAMRPRLLLLDEPAAGLNDAETEDLGVLIRKLRDGGVTTLIVEHAMPLVMTLCDRVVVLDFGRKIAEGTPATVQLDPAVIEAYLGTNADPSDA